MGLNSLNFRAWFHAHQISACVMIEKTDNCKREISNRKGYEMKIVAMMPARLGSTRVKNKNLRLINKKPLIQYIIDTAIKSKLLDQALYEQLLSIESKLSRYIDNTNKPSLLHGDLWSGNVINGKDNPYFIDSACYFGHREIDFALIHMFGGFNDDFFNAYNENYQLEEGFEQRKPIYMLYHYLNHLNIFGKGYYSGVENCTSYILNH